MPYVIDLSGHRALVTGAGQGVGRGIATTLAEAGAEVLVNDLVSDRAEAVVGEIENAGGKARAAAFDVTDHGAVSAAVAELGPVDVLVNNAGNAGKAATMGFEDMAPFVQTEPDSWDPFLDVNMYGVMYAVRAVLPGMIDAQWGRIVTVISDTARVGEVNMAAYSAAKAGAAGFCRSIAREVGRYGITVNCIALGTMNTQDIAPEEDTFSEQLLKRYVVRRRGLPRDVAHMVTSLAAPGADWVTGQTIPVNGGYSFNL